MTQKPANNAEPLEAEPLDSNSQSEPATPAPASGPSQPRPLPRPRPSDAFPWPWVGVLAIVALMVAAAWSQGWFSPEKEPQTNPDDRPVVAGLRWYDPVWLPRAPECIDSNNGQLHPEYAIGYEPSLAVDSAGNLYYTAHKDLRWAGPNGGPGGGEGGLPGPGPFACNPFPGSSTSWDYYASWFFVSQDGGKTWGPPNDWGLEVPVLGYDFGAMAYGGDEGDIAVDANDRVYFVDTTLVDVWLHRWENGGNRYIPAIPVNSLALDDRPWVSAQGDGIVHYLGNSGATPPQDCWNGPGRYWYYRSTDGGNTFTDQCFGLPGGWAHIAAERNGDHVYIAQEANNDGSGGIQVWVNDNQGALDSWSEPVIVGPLNGTHPEGYPWVAAGENGTVFVAWQESPEGGRKPGTLYISRSDDYGRTWEYWDISAGHPFEEGGVYLYPNLDVGPGNVVGYAYYGNQGDHTAGDEWHLYAAMLEDPKPGDLFEFHQADPLPLHTSSQAEADSDDLHPLHDFFEVVIDPNDLSLNIAYQYNLGDHPFEDGEEQRYLMFIKADWVGEG